MIHQRSWRYWRLTAEILRCEGAPAASLRASKIHVIAEAKVSRESRSRNIRMLTVTYRVIVVRGLMATCDIFGERSMQYATYASANSYTGRSPAGPAWARPGSPGEAGRNRVGGYCDPVPRDGAERITGNQREKGDKLMTLRRIPSANSAKRGGR